MECSPLHRLPLELRELIFEYVVYQQTPIRIELSTGKPELISDNKRNYLSLTKTCTQVRRESLGIFYGSNTFSLHTDHIGTSHPHYGLRNSWQHALRDWRNQIGDANALCLRDVYIDIGSIELAGVSRQRIWTSISTMLPCFELYRTRLYIRWIEMRRFEVLLPVTNADAAHAAMESIVAMRSRFHEVVDSRSRWVYLYSLDPEDTIPPGEISERMALRQELKNIVDLIREHQSRYAIVQKPGLWDHVISKSTGRREAGDRHA